MKQLIDSWLTTINSIGGEFWHYAAGMFIQSGVLILSLLTIDFLLRKRVRATFRYWLWILVFIKLILPPSLSLPTGVGYWFGYHLSADSVVLEVPSNTALPEPVAAPAPEYRVISAEIPYAQPPEINLQPTTQAAPAVLSLPPLTWGAVAFLLWLAGVSVISLLVIRRIKFVRQLIAQSTSVEARLAKMLNQCRREVGVRRDIQLRLSTGTPSPAVCGLFKPTILMPAALPDKLSTDKLRAVLIHELAHIKRGDLWINSAQTVLQIIYFYNPLVWLANAVVRRTREQAVDEMVLVALGAGANSYSDVLIDIAEMAFFKTSLSLRLIGVVESKKALHGRIRHMLNRPMPKNAKLGILGLMTVVILGIVLLPMAKAQKQSVDNTAAVSDSDKNGSTYLSEAKLKTSLNAVDSDGDGLPDFQEVHKYLTDPAKRDTDGDGLPDGDWNERREYTYSVRTILKFMPPFDKAALNDDYQDTLVMEETDDYIEIEVIHYPLATLHESIEENPNWQRDYAGMTEYLKTGVTTNWDAKMKQDLLTELRADGILINKLTDKQVVEQVSSWLMNKSKSFGDIFTTYYIHFPNGQPSIYSGLEDAFIRHKGKYGWTNQQQFEHELLGKGMFYNKTHGTCTSFAVYLTTVLRALGVPTRMIIVTPVVDASNREQLRWVKDRITHNKAREIMLAGLRNSSQGFTAHTFNEVYVGNRWHRLNYKKLGQPILDEQCFGLHTHLYTFNDLSEANLAPTWGLRYGKGIRSAVFEHSNPYSAVTLSDLFGCHSNILNPLFTAQALSSSPLPNIFILEPDRREPSDFSIWDEVTARIEQATGNKTGRLHKKECYDDIFNGVFAKKSGDVIVLLFSLDTKERIPEDYKDLLPKPWPEIEADLQKGNTVGLEGKARDSNIILMAAPKREQLRQFIRESELLRLSKTGQAEGRKPLVLKTRPSSGLPNIFIMSPSSIRMFREIFDMVKDVTWNKTGRYHEKKSYDDILIDGIWNRKPGDIIVLLFLLDSPDRIPSEYEDILPKPWPEIEATLRQGKTVELGGKARELNVVLLAASTNSQLRSLVQESKLLNALAKPAQSRLQTSGFTAISPNGVAVELFGVCDWPKEGKRCWQPDGSQLPLEIYAVKWKQSPGVGQYGFMFKVTGPDDLKFSCNIFGANSTEGSCKVIDAFGRQFKDLTASISDMEKGRLSTTIRIGVAAGPWETIASHDGRRMTIGRQGGVLWSQAFQTFSGTYIVASREWRKDQTERAVAIDKEGKLHTTDHGSVASGKIDQLTASFRNLKLDQIEEFQYQVRPYQWVEFKNVSLRPGHKTDVEF